MKSEVDDWLSELPPLDGADDELTPDADEDDDLPPGADDDGSLDDSASDDLPIDETLDSVEGEAPADADEDRWEADVGEPELDLLDDDASELAEGEPAESNDGDGDIDDDLPASDDDAGEEGTTDAIDQGIDESLLPALDADDEGDFEDALLLEPGFAPSESRAMAWSTAPWNCAETSERAEVAQGDVVVRTVLHAATATLVSVLARGAICIERSPENEAARIIASPVPGAEPPHVALTARDSALTIWAASPQGEVAKSTDGGRTWTACARLPGVVALGADVSGAITAITRDGEGYSLQTSVDGTSFTRRRVTLGFGDGGEKNIWIALGGSEIAVGGVSDVFVAEDGVDFVRVPRLRGASAGTWTRTAGDTSLVVAEPGADDNAPRLVRIAGDGACEILAELGEDDEDEVVVHALAWDGHRRAVLVLMPNRVDAYVAPLPKRS